MGSSAVKISTSKKLVSEKKARKQDALALAQLIYDIFKKDQRNG